MHRPVILAVLVVAIGLLAGDAQSGTGHAGGMEQVIGRISAAQAR